jgi:hypothetical protein
VFWPYGVWFLESGDLANWALCDLVHIVYGMYVDLVICDMPGQGERGKLHGMYKGCDMPGQERNTRYMSTVLYSTFHSIAYI